MTYIYDIRIVASGSTSAVRIFDKFCNNGKLRYFDFGGLKLNNDYHSSKSVFIDVERQLEYMEYISSKCKVYSFCSDNEITKQYFAALCKTFPNMNLYYYAVGDWRDLEAICQENRVISYYKKHDDTGIFKYKVPTKDTFVSNIFTEPLPYMNIDKSTKHTNDIVLNPIFSRNL